MKLSVRFMPIQDIIDPTKLSLITNDKQVVIAKRLVKFGKTFMKPGKFIRKVANKELTEVEISNFVSLLLGDLESIKFDVSVSTDFRSGYFANIDSCLMDSEQAVKALENNTDNIRIILAKIGDIVYGRALLFNDETNVWLAPVYGNPEAKVAIYNYARKHKLLRKENLVTFTPKNSLVGLYLDDFTISRDVVIPSSKGKFIRNTTEQIKQYLKNTKFIDLKKLEDNSYRLIEDSKNYNTTYFIDNYEKLNPLNVEPDWATVTLNGEIVDLYNLLIEENLLEKSL